MSTTGWIIIGGIWIATLFFAVLCGIMIDLRRNGGRKPVGTLYVNREENEIGEGVYVAFTEDPKAFTDGSPVILEVRIIRKESTHDNGT